MNLPPGWIEPGRARKMTGRAATDEDEATDVAYVVGNARQIMRRGHLLQRDTVFFRAVIGGNARIVRKTLHVLKEDGEDDVLNWLLLPTACQQQQQQQQQQRGMVKSACMFLVLVVLFPLAFTPLFSVIQGLLAGMLIGHGKKADESSLLPFLACLGESEDMLRILKKHGMRLDQFESDGRNVFHQLVDYSNEDPTKAVEAFQRILSVYRDKVRRPCLKQTDLNGLTALECAAKYGSPQFLDVLLKTTGETLVSISPSSFFDISRPTTAASESNSQGPNSNQRRYAIIRHDVTQYESGGVFRKHSLLLTLLAARNLEGLDAKDLDILLKNKLLETWRRLKQKCTGWMMVADHVYRLTLTCVGLWFCFIITQDLEPTSVTFPLTQQFLEELESVLISHRNNSGNATSYAEACPAGTKWILPVGFTSDQCEEQAFQIIRQKCVGSVDVGHLMRQLQLDKISDLWTMTGTPLVLLNVLTGCAVYQLFKSTITALVFLVQNLRGYPLTVGIRRTLSTNIPGSKVDQFLQDGTAWVVVVYRWHIYKLNNTDTFNVSLKNYIKGTSHLLALYMLLLCVSVLIAVRLVPRIGYFILTTVQLTKCLGQFLVVYGLIFLATSTISLYIMRDPDCLVARIPEYSDLYSSMYATYKLLYGAGAFYYDLNIDSQVLFGIYSVYCVLLLLNLIIAIMSAMAEQLSDPAWKKATWENEYVDEYLAYEILFNVGCWALGVRYKVLEWAGFVVEDQQKKGKRVNIDIEIY